VIAPADSRSFNAMRGGDGVVQRMIGGQEFTVWQEIAQEPQP
jgi:hypothetical protein